MIIRFQIGAYAHAAPWRALRLAVNLMTRLEPLARIVIRAQGAPPQWFTAPAEFQFQVGETGIRGRHLPARLGPTEHEVWLDNDHIMWDLPDAWKRWKFNRNAGLLWQVPWGYYGRYSDDVVGNYSAGMWGMPPERGWGECPPDVMDDADEMGWVIREVQMRTSAQLEVTYDEVTCYCPGHPVLSQQANRLGSCGTHLMSLNRGWSPAGEQMLEALEAKYL